MNKDELIVLKYLQLTHGTNIIFEPNGNKSPDFLLNSNIAIEVRRLNQHFFSKCKLEGLETLSYQLNGAINDVLVSFDTMFSGKSYWIFLRYKRPISDSIKRTKKLIYSTLLKFIKFENIALPHELIVNKSIILEIHESLPIEGRIFRFGGEDDQNAGGFVISTYIENIQHCIHEKSEKIKNEKHKFKLWHFYLVDHLNFGLDFQDIIEVKKIVTTLEEFDKLVLINIKGNLILEIDNQIYHD